jgi:hypothetical protein
VNVSKDFEELFAFFRKHGVEFVIVGGYAVSFHAKPRYTKDIDVLVRSTRDNAERLVAALTEFGFGSVGLGPDDFTKDGMIVQLGRPPNRIDLLTSISGVSFQSIWENRCAGRFGDVDVDYIGRDELIGSRERAVAGRFVA